MNPILKKVLKYVFFTGVVFLGVVIVVGIFTNGKYEEYRNALEWWKYERTMAPYQAEADRIEALKKADTFGGKTPEATLQMYIEALKKGDIGLASKYCVVENQNKEVSNYKKIISLEGSLDQSVKTLIEKQSKGKMSCSSVSHCVLNYEYVTLKDEKTVGYLGTEKREWIRPAGTKVTSTMVFDINKYTNVWKISN
ncbi:MAG: hypothetical protein WCF94_00090 [bacterium]